MQSLPCTWHALRTPTSQGQTQTFRLCKGIMRTAMRYVNASKCVNAGLIALQFPSIVTNGCGAKSSALESQIIRDSRFLKKAKVFLSLKRIPLLETLQFEQTPWKAGAFSQGERACE